MPLALPPLEDGQDGESIVLCGMVTTTKLVQNCGRAFFEKFEAGSSPDPSPSPSDSGEDDGETNEFASPDRERKKKPKKERDDGLKLHDLIKNENLYALLECDEGCSQDDLKKAYRRLCLVHHPDKQSQDKTPEEMEAINKTFLKLQEAFEVLNDPKKRRKYDSIGDFDDHVPSTLKKNQDFFVVFGPVFRRNAKWSERKPVPDLGDENLPYEKVEQFYEFWRNFESWRDMDEKVKEEEGEDCFFNMDEAECREERRWMERENEKLRNKFRKLERARVLKLASNAEALDPRVKAERDRKWAIREAEKAEKEAKRLELERQQREEAERQAAIERELEEKRKAEKERRDQEREVKKKSRAKLRKRVSDLQLGLVEDQLQEFLLVLEQSELESLTSEIISNPVPETVFNKMREKSFEPMIIKKSEDERSTAEGASSEEEEDTPEKRAENERLAEERRIQQEKRAKMQAEREAVERKQREEEAAVRAEEKAVRDAKKKVEMEKREAERKKAEKKEQEKRKREQEKALKDSQKALEKAEKEKEENRKRAEEQSEKQRLENEALALQRQQETRQMALERDRLKRVEALEKMEWSSVIEAAKEASVQPAVAAMLNANKKDGEDRVDAQLAALGSFFILGVRPAQDSPTLSSSLRNRIKKLRTRLRTSAAAGEFGDPPVVAADVAGLEEVLLRVTSGKLDEEVAEGAASTEAPVRETEVPSSKKKAKAKAKPADEDLDALLKEFGVETSSKKKNNKKK